MYRRTLHTYCEPSIIKDKQQITFSNLLHPLLTEAVPNTLNIKHNILLTGSNASGKSTFMKAVATNLKERIRQNGLLLQSRCLII